MVLDNGFMDMGAGVPVGVSQSSALGAYAHRSAP